MRSPTINLLFPELYQFIEECVLDEFPHLRYEYFEKRKEREVSELAYAIVLFEVVHFDDEWLRYNEQNVQRFVKNFAVFNNAMNQTPALEVDPFVILNISL